ncbi:MAG: Sir2 silent information regulator family NAD-dependent deacetylase [Synergistes sp.]|nr:Sir2 silent information regulator family NAD-dependent deacetylase [Synergistes sp.]
MKDYYSELPNGYLETIQNGLRGVQTFSPGISRGSGAIEENIERLKNEIGTADAIVIGAGAGLSAAAGFTYSGERFEKYFFDFAAAFGIRDIYSGGFYAFPDEETRWAWWARHIYYNRYVKAPGTVYMDLHELVTNKNYFVITTNVDHQFQKSGFDKKRLFYTQGDYGLFQNVNPENRRTYDNEGWVMQAMEAQGFVKDEKGAFKVPADRKIYMKIPSALIPKCPDDGSHVAMNLRSDESFVEDEGWHRASAAYSEFLKKHEGMHILFLEIGVGMNTPVIVKFPFWQMTNDDPKAVYACLNYNEACCPQQIEKRSICIGGDCGKVIKGLLLSRKATVEPEHIAGSVKN